MSHIFARVGAIAPTLISAASAHVGCAVAGATSAMTGAALSTNFSQGAILIGGVAVAVVHGLITKDLGKFSTLLNRSGRNVMAGVVGSLIMGLSCGSHHQDHNGQEETASQQAMQPPCHRR